MRGWGEALLPRIAGHAAQSVTAALIAGATLGLLAAPTAPAGADTIRGKVVRVVDGDTVEVLIKVRLAGVDTPETVHPRRPVERCGPEASAATREALEGRRVTLRVLPRNLADRYGRLIADIHRERSWNVELVRLGLGRAVFRWPLEDPDAFRRAGEEAEGAERGIWSEGPDCDPR